MNSPALALLCLSLVTACGSDSSSAPNTTPDASDGTGGATTGSGGATGSGGTVTGSGGVATGGATTGSGGATSTGGNGGDSGTDLDGGSDGGSTDGGDGSTTCEFGSASSFATQAELNLFGNIVYFAAGDELPAGRYRLTYQDGCMKYSSTQDWTIHAYPAGANAAWWIVGDDSNQRIVVPPGTSGYATSNGAFTTFEECVAANQALAPVEFDFAGGKLGVWLLDSNYGDNLAGTDGRNPKWKLTLLGACTPGDQ